MTTLFHPNCWRFEPGVVLTLERTLEPPVAAHVWLSPAEAPVFFPSSGTVLRRYYTPPGDELRVLAELSARRNVISASLNYLGDATAYKVAKSKAVPRLESSLESCQYFTALDSEEIKPQCLFDPNRGNQIQLPDIPKQEPIALVIDTGLRHAECVVYQLTTVYRELSQEAHCRYIALTTVADTGWSAHLCTLCRLLMVGGEIKNPVVVVNLSFDLGEACDLSGGCNTPEAAVLYSFPFFEACLDEFLAARRRQGDTPFIVAAAGNRANGKNAAPRWRMAYPASLPDVWAVTCLAEDPQEDPKSLSVSVDCPAVGPLKPCFAESVHPFKDRFAAYEVAKNPRTTSYAAAAFSGRVMAMAAKSSQETEQIGKTETSPVSGFGALTRLVRQSAAVTVGIESPPNWIPSVVRHITKNTLLAPSPMAELCPQLFSDVNCIALWISSEKILTRLYSVLHWFHKRLEVNIKNPRENRCFQTVIVCSFG